MISECLTAVGNRTMGIKLQNYEMEKYVKLNEDVLDDEINPTLIDTIQDITVQLKRTIDDYKKIAKAKGRKYNVEGIKEERRQEKKRRNKDSLALSMAGSKANLAISEIDQVRDTRSKERYVTGAPLSVRSNASSQSRTSLKQTNKEHMQTINHMKTGPLVMVENVTKSMEKSHEIIKSGSVQSVFGRTSKERSSLDKQTVTTTFNEGDEDDDDDDDSQITDAEGRMAKAEKVLRTRNDKLKE